jgi:hypothetical protein
MKRSTAARPSDSASPGLLERASCAGARCSTTAAGLQDGPLSACPLTRGSRVLPLLRSRRQDARLEKFSWQSVESGGSRSSKR